MRKFLLPLVALMLVAGGGKTKKLNSTEKEHYYALKVFMDKHVEKAFFKGKTKEARDAYLKRALCDEPLGCLWERFYQFDEARRDQIVSGDVTVGFKQEQVLMAWGFPHKRKRLTGRPASRSELFIYRFEVDWEGYVTVWKPGSTTAHKAKKLYQIDVYLDTQNIDDGAFVTELVERDGWQD